jgi:hypothetical protein
MALPEGFQLIESPFDKAKKERGLPEGFQLIDNPFRISQPGQQEEGIASLTPRGDPNNIVRDAEGNITGMSGAAYLASVEKRKKETPSRSASDFATDAGITLLKSTIGLPESIVGLADIPTLGYAGKILKKAGYDPKEAREILDSYLSEAQQVANRKVGEAKGFLPTVQALVENPSVIANSIVESAPQIVGGVAAARGIMGLGAKAVGSGMAGPALPGVLTRKVGADLAPIIAGGLGEGLMGAGSAAEQIRQGNKDELLTGKQAVAALGSGLGTAAFGIAGGRLANKLGLEDIDTMLVSSSRQGASKSVGDFAKRALFSGISEGLFEEMPQSAQEKMWQNYATDRPLLEGVPEAAAQGAIVGAAMGVGATSLGGIKSPPPSGLASLPAATPPTTPVPPTNAPIIATTTVTTGGKTSTKVTRSDGSVDIDGVQVTPPTGPVAPTGGIATLTPQEITGEESQDQQQLIDEADQILGTPAVTPVTVAEPQDITDILPKERAPEGNPSVPKAIETEQTETQRPAEPKTPVITGGAATPPLVTPKQPEQTPNIKDALKAYKDDLETAAGLLADDLVGQTHLTGEMRGIIDTYLKDGADAGSEKLLEAMDNPNSGFGLLGLDESEKIAYLNEVHDYLKDHTEYFQSLNLPATPANPPATPAEKTDLEKIHEAYATYKGKDYQGTKELADFKVGRLQEVANQRGIPINVWKHQGKIITLGDDATKPKGASLIGTIKPVLPVLPAGQYNMRDQFQHDGRTWEVESIKHTGKQLGARTVDKGKHRRQQFEIEQPKIEATEGPNVPPSTSEKPPEEATPTGGAPTEESTEGAAPTEEAPTEAPTEEAPVEGAAPAEEGTETPAAPTETTEEGAAPATPPATTPEEGGEKPAEGGTTAGPSTPAGPGKPQKIKLTDEEKAKAAEEKKAADEAKAKAAEEKAAADKAEEERKKKLEEFNKQPMKVAMDEKDAAQVASLLYGRTVPEELFPSIQTEGLIRLPVDMGAVPAIEAALGKYGFTITDRSIPAATDDPSYTGPERITISALYKPEKTSIQGGGAEFGGNRKGKPKPVQPITKDATDGQITKMLAAVSKDVLLDVTSNPDSSFGAMMYKEGIAHYIASPTDYMLQRLKKSSTLYISSQMGGKQAIKLALQRGMETQVQTMLQDYADALNGLQQIFDSNPRIAELSSAIQTKYIKDKYAPKAIDQYTEEGNKLQSTMQTKTLVRVLDEMYRLFSLNEDSTDQTDRVVKKETEVPPELTNIIRRGMRDHRQGRNVDVEDFINTFGLFPGGVDFGNWVNQTERAAHLNAIYDAMYDLADLSGISPKMLGLGQKLKMAVGAQGRGGKTAAHFIKGLNEINLTKTKGDGTLGHEWQHGLDYNLRKTQNGKTLMEDTAIMLRGMMDLDTVENNLRSILRDAANTADNRNMPPKKAMFTAITQGRYNQQPDIYRNSTKTTDFVNNALILDNGKSPPYWSSPEELLSRGFESMLFDASKGGSPYLVGPDRADGYISKKNGYAGTSYPTGKERPIINEVFKQFLAQIDPETLQVKTYERNFKIVNVPELGYALLDQNNLSTGNDGTLIWYQERKEAERMKSSRDGNDFVFTPYRMQLGRVNGRILDIAQRVDAIMEEMGLFKWPEIKNGSMAESMFYHMRQGWWPKNNRELAEYGIKAYLQNPELLGFNPDKDQREIDKYKITDFEGDRVKLKQTQEDFEAAATRYISQVITDMRAAGSDTKAIYDHIVNLYQNQPTLDVQSVLSKTNNAYSTPLPIAFLAGMLARVKSTTTVLDPTGGNGMLVVAANPQNVTTFEIDPHRANNMDLMQIGNVIEGDALEEVKKLRDQEVDVVLANPPFGALSSAVKVPSWTGKDYRIGTLDQLIAAESLRAMANNGRAVLILGAHPKPGTITSTDRVFLNWLYDNYNVADHFEIAGNLYRKQGASWPLRVLVIAGRNQTANAYPTDFTVDRVTTFDELWSRYVQTSDRSEKVVVGSGKKQPASGGANQQPGGVPTGNPLEDGDISDENGAGDGLGIGKPLPPTGGGAGTSGTGGRGTTGGNGTGKQQPPAGADKRGGSGGSETSGTGGRSGSGEPSGDELGGLSDLDLDDIFDNLGKPDTPKGGAKTGSPRTPSTPRAPKGENKGGPRTPRGPAVQQPTVIPTELEGLGLEDLLGELDEALNGKPPAPPAPPAPPKPPTAPTGFLLDLSNKPKRENKKPTQETKKTAPLLLTYSALSGMDNYHRAQYLEYLKGQQVKDAMARIAQNTKNTSDDPNSGLYSRKGDQDYANVQPIIQRVWEAIGQKISDVTQRIKQVYALLVTKFGEPIKAHLRTFVEGLRNQQKRRPKNQTPVQAEPIDTESRVVYLGKSRFASDGIYLPRAQSQSAYSALENLEAQVGDIDEFVADELGYSSVEQMAKGLAGYQIDGLALAIQANKLGKGFIIGDDTGVGKGRAAAAMLVWAKKNGKIPIFVTLSDSLYSAMYEDLANIGHEDIKIGMTNNDAIIQKNIGNGQTKVMFQNKGKNGPDLMSYITKNGALPKGMDVLFTSYSQLNGGAGSPARQNAIASLVAAGKAVLVMDEAHNAAGVPSNPDSMGQNAFFMSLLTGKNLLGKDKDAPEDWKPPSALYLSATFAKRPDNMPLYIHTNLRYAADTPEELTQLFSQGVKTDVLQQVSSEMLVESGSMLRRERSYEGVTMDFITDEANAPRDTREVDRVTSILRSLVSADRALKEWLKTGDAQKDIVEKLGPKGSMLGREGPNAFSQARSNMFTSVVHNYIGTLLLSTKTQTAVDMVVDKMNNGEKVVIGLQNTNGSALDDFVQKNNIKIGDEISNFGWQTLIQRAIDSTRKVTLKAATGDKKDDVKVEVPYAMMPPTIRAGYDKLAGMIKDFQSDLPVAPIDFIRTELERKYVWTIDGKTHVGDTPPPGVKARHLVVKEVTGRNTAIDYRGDKPKYMALDNPERVQMISQFQNGEDSAKGPIDVLVINSAGATGISLHASVEAFDQRPRHMIVLQPHGDISVFIQLLGRIHRTGQVEWPSFTMLATGIPAERRILAMLRKKLSSLKSNTSGGSSSTKVNGVDFINMYGDVATAEYLNEHADIREFLGEPLFPDPDKEAGTDLAHKASGTAGLLSSADQQEFFDSIEASYEAAIELRNATGTNALERRVLPLNAEMIKENLIEEGLDNSNPFLADVVMAQFNTDVIGSIPTEQNIKDDIAQALNGRSPQQVVDDIDADLNTIFIESRNQIILRQQEISKSLSDPTITEKEQEQLTALQAGLNQQFATLGARREKTLTQLKSAYAIGSGFTTFEINNVPASAVVVGIKVDKSRIGKSKTGNPYSPSNFQIILKRNIPEGRVSPTLATLEGPSIEKGYGSSRNPPLADWFALRSVTGGRTQRYIALGNILRAAQLFEKDGGELAKFTLTNQDDPVSGVIMPVKYQPVAISEQSVRLRNPNAASQFLLGAWHRFLQKKYEDTQYDTYKDVADQVKPLLIDGLPDFGPLEEAKRRNYSGTILRGSKNMWTLTLDTYRPNNGFRLTIDESAPKKFISSPAIKDLVGSMAKKRNGPYEMSDRSYIRDPEKAAALVKFLHKNYPATVEAEFSTLARDLMKVEFDNSEASKGLLSRAVAEGGQSVEAVQSQLFPIEGITVNVVQSADNLPDDAAPSDVEGAWYSGTTVYLVADNLPNAKRVQEVLAHEAVGHAAMEAMLGPEMMAKLVKEIQGLEKTSSMIQKVAAQVDRTQPGLSAERRAKEIVAVMAERGLHKGLVQRVFQAIRNFLKKLGFTIQFSDGDVLALLRNAEKFVGGQFTPGGEGLYSVNYKGNPAPLASFQAPTELNKLDTFLYKYQDKHIDTKRILEIIQKQNVDIKDNWDPYLKEELYHGRVAKQTKDFIEDEFRPLLEDMNKRKITVLQFEEYLHNRHAKIRNEFVADRNKRPDMQDGGSGLFNNEVDDYMKDLDTKPELKKNFEELAEKVDAMVKQTQELMVSTGLEKQSTIDSYRAMLPFYVPLKRDPDELEFVNASSGMGRGFNVKGSTSKSAIGSHKTVVNILGNLALEREKVIVRGEKALVGRALYALAIQNPNTNFWKPINPEAIKNKQKLVDEMLDMDMTLRDAENIIQESKTGRLDKQTGLVKYEINPMLRDSPNVLAVRINGEDRYVFFNPGNKTALRMVESLKNIDAAQMDGFIKQASAVTRFIAAVSTQYNPVFGAFNFFRDVQGAAINLSSTPIADKKLQVVSDSRSAVRAIYRNLRGKAATTPEMQEWMDLFEKYQNAGGATGFRDQFSKNDEKETLVERELGRLSRNNVKKAVGAVADWLSNYNDAMENAVRLSAFKAALDVPGMSVDRAASIAKNLTVNFNRKGASTQTIGALYAFFNAAVQGSARLAKTLFVRNADGKIRLSPAGMKIIAGGVLIGVAQTAILAMAGFGPDDPSEWIKEKNLIIPTGGGGYLTIPMPLGFNLFPNLGRVLSEYMMVQSGAMKGKRDIKKTVTYLATSILDTFNPLGSSTFAQTLTPTLVDPLVAVSENKDAFGRPISKEDRGLKPTPGYERSRDSANGLSQAIAYALNYVTGGGEKGIGLVSPTADQLSYIAGQYTGGVGKLGIQSYEYVKSKITGDEIQSYQVPVAGKLYGDINTPAAISGKFYENLKDMSQHERIIKDMKGKGVAKYIKENPEAALRNRANYVENEIVRLKKEKKALVERNAPDEQIKRKDDRIKELMDNFNKSVIKLQ